MSRLELAAATVPLPSDADLATGEDRSQLTVPQDSADPSNAHVTGGQPDTTEPELARDAKQLPGCLNNAVSAASEAASCAVVARSSAMAGTAGSTQGAAGQAEPRLQLAGEPSCLVGPLSSPALATSADIYTRPDAQSEGEDHTVLGAPTWSCYEQQRQVAQQES